MRWHWARSVPGALSTIQGVCGACKLPSPHSYWSIGDYQAASHGVVIITLMCNKSTWCNKLRQGSVLTLHTANSFIVTARRCEFSFLGRAEEAVKCEERTKGDECSLQDRFCTPDGSSGHPTPNIFVLNGIRKLGCLTMPTRIHLNLFSYQCICILQSRIL